MITTIRFNAFDRNSNASFSETVRVQSSDEIMEREKEFEGRVPFKKFYFDHEFVDGDEKVFDRLEAK
jgi:hypothetical protein